MIVKNYYRVMLGRQSIHAANCFAGGYIGADFEIPQDLTGDLPDDWRAFNRKFIPIFLSNHPDKTKIGAGLACGALWTVSKGIQKGDIVLSPDGSGCYRVGEISGDYFYAPGDVLPHRRPVHWFSDEEALYIKEVTEEKIADESIKSTVISHRDDGIYLNDVYKEQVNQMIQDAYDSRGRYEELTDPKYTDDGAIFDIMAMTVIGHHIQSNLGR